LTQGNPNLYNSNGWAVENQNHNEQEKVLRSLLQAGWDRDEYIRVKDIADSTLPLDQKIAEIKALQSNGISPSFTHEILKNSPKTIDNSLDTLPQDLFDFDLEKPDLLLDETSEESTFSESIGNYKNTSLFSHIEQILESEIQEEAEDSKEEIEKNRKKLVNQVTSGSFFYYLFGSYWEIRRFAKQTQVLRPKFFLRFTMDPLIPQFFSKALVLDTVIPLQQVVEKMLKQSWQFLNKLDYNLLVGLNRLCISLMKVDFTKTPTNPIAFSERLRFVYPEFISFYAYPKFIKQTQEIVNYLWEIMDSFDGSPAEYIYRIRAIFEPKLMQPSLFNALLSPVLVKSRRFISFKEMIHPKPGVLFDEESFEVSGPVENLIQNYLKNLEKELSDAFVKLEKYRILRLFVPRKKNGDPDTKLLEQLYNQHLKGRFSKDQESISLFAAHFLRTFVELSAPILTAEFKTNASDKSMVFSSQIFEKFSSRLLYLSDQLQRHHDHAPGFHKERFLTLELKIKGVEPASKKEKLIVADVDEAMSLLRSIAEKLAYILNTKKPAPEGEMEMAPLENFLIQSGRFVLPFESALILEAGMFANKSVEEVLFEICQIANSFCAFLGERELSAQRREEEIAKQKVKNYIKIYQRIANTKQLLNFRNRFKEHLKKAKEL
jgi:hypothetical protein